MKVNVCALPSYRKQITCKVVDKVLCCVRLTANRLESDSHELLDEKRSLSARAICGEDVLAERARLL